MLLPWVLFFSFFPNKTSSLSPSSTGTLQSALATALAARRDLLATLHERRTNCYRLLHGATEGMPGLTVDRYGDTLLFQTFRGSFEVDEGDAELIVELTEAVERELSSLLPPPPSPPPSPSSDTAAVRLRPILSHRGEVAEGASKATRRTLYRSLQLRIDELRGDQQSTDDADAASALSSPAAEWGERGYRAAEVGLENGLAFDVTPRPGQDPGVYLDFRVGREWVRAHAKGKHVLNCFSYTATAGVAAAAGGARSVTNVDFSPSALGVGRVNVRLNGEQFQALGQRYCGADSLRAALDGRQETLTSALKAWRDESEDEDGGGGEDDGVTVASVAYEGFKLLRADMLPTLRQLGGLPPGGRRTKQQANNNNGGGRGGRGGWRGGGGGGRGSGGRHGGRGGGGGGGKSRAALYFPAQTFDLVVLDPPTFSSSPFGAVDIVRDYQSLLKPAALATAPDGGALLVTNHVSGVDLAAWLDQCERCCAKAGRPLAAPPEVLEPHADFPPMDDRRHPLKIAVLRV